MAAVITSTPTHYAHTITVNGHALTADEPERLGGKNAGPAPFDLYLASLAACTAITLRMYAERKQWPLEGVEVELDYTQRDKHRTAISRTVHLRGPLDAAQRERLLQIADACPVHRILTGEVAIATTAGE